MNRLCPADPHHFERPFLDPREDAPLLFALAVELLGEERVARYHRLQPMHEKLTDSLHASPFGEPVRSQGGSRTLGRLSVLVVRPALCRRYRCDEPRWAESTAQTKVPHLSTRVR